MPWPVTFGLLSGGNQPLQLFDTMFGQVAVMVDIPCSLTGTNAITLTPFSTAPQLTAYSNFVSFIGLATSTSTGVVTAGQAGLAQLPVFQGDGVTQVGSGGIVAGELCTFIYNAALGINGGFYLATLTPTGGSSSPVLRNTRLFVSSGSFVVPSGVTAVWVQLVGGGGAGAGCGTGQYGGGGGASGGAAFGWVTVTPGATIAVTVGPGGNGAPGATGVNTPVIAQGGGSTSFGAFMSATGGGGGGYGFGGCPGGTPGFGAGGQVNLWGIYGSDGCNTNVNIPGGFGGASLYGGGGKGSSATSSALGAGAGGGGVYLGISSTVAGSGQPGAVTVLW